jgi:hypothetical protein
VYVFIPKEEDVTIRKIIVCQLQNWRAKNEKILAGVHAEISSKFRKTFCQAKNKSKRCLKLSNLCSQQDSIPLFCFLFCDPRF